MHMTMFFYVMCEHVKLVKHPHLCMFPYNFWFSIVCGQLTMAACIHVSWLVDYMYCTCIHVHAFIILVYMHIHILNFIFHIMCCISKVNPVRRITIQGIREHPWFTVDLPDYLFPLGDPGASQMDSLALSEVCQKLGVPPHEVVAAVRGGIYTQLQVYNNNTQSAAVAHMPSITHPFS